MRSVANWQAQGDEERLTPNGENTIYVRPVELRLPCSTFIFYTENLAYSVCTHTTVQCHTAVCVCVCVHTLPSFEVYQQNYTGTAHHGNDRYCTSPRLSLHNDTAYISGRKREREKHKNTWDVFAHMRSILFILHIQAWAPAPGSPTHTHTHTHAHLGVHFCVTWSSLSLERDRKQCAPLTFKKRLKMHLFREYNGT